MMQPARQVPGIRKTVLIVLGIMLSMTLIGLSYALWTTKLRRTRDPHRVEVLEPIAFRRPLELSGLGYIPSGSQIVLGLQLAELLEDETGKRLAAEPRPALLEWFMKQIPRLSGLKAEQIDHVLISTSFGATFPQAIVVMRTRPKYSLEKLVSAIQPTRSSLHQDKPLYEFSLKPLGEAMLWCVEEHTLVYVIRQDPPKMEHLQGISATPRPPPEVLSGPLHDMLGQRMAKHQFLWVVGRLEELGPLKIWLPVLLADRVELGPLLEAKAFGLGVEPLDGLTLTGHFQLPDAGASARLKTYLEKVRVPGATSQKAEAPPPDVPDQWVTWQVRTDVPAMRKVLNQGTVEKN